MVVIKIALIVVAWILGTGFTIGRGTISFNHLIIKGWCSKTLHHLFLCPHVLLGQTHVSERYGGGHK